MDRSIEFDDEAQFMTIEIDDVMIDQYLTPKLESEHPPISQQYPSQLFGQAILTPHPPCSAQQATRFLMQMLRPSPGPSGHPLPEGEGQTRTSKSCTQMSKRQSRAKARDCIHGETRLT